MTERQWECYDAADPTEREAQESANIFLKGQMVTILVFAGYWVYCKYSILLLQNEKQLTLFMVAGI